MGKIRVFKPVAETRTKEISGACKPSKIDGKRVGLLWNRKPNADLLLLNIKEALEQRLRMPTTFLFMEKPLPSSAAPPNVIEEMTKSCDFVILAIGD